MSSTTNTAHYLDRPALISFSSEKNQRDVVRQHLLPPLERFRAAEILLHQLSGMLCRPEPSLHNWKTETAIAMLLSAIGMSRESFLISARRQFGNQMLEEAVKLTKDE